MREWGSQGSSRRCDLSFSGDAFAQCRSSNVDGPIWDSPVEVIGGMFLNAYHNRDSETLAEFPKRVHLFDPRRKLTVQEFAGKIWDEEEGKG